MSVTKQTSQDKDRKLLMPGERILRALLNRIEEEAMRMEWDKGHPPGHDVYHDTRYHDHHQTWSQSK